MCFDVLSAENKLPAFHHRSDLIMPESLLIPEPLFFEKTAKGSQKVICKTCHGIKNIQDQDFKKIDQKRNDFLRAGPYEKLSDFCYLCHEKKKNQRENIHILLDSQLKKIEKKCLYCHSEVLKPKELKELKPQQLQTKVSNDTKKYDLKLRVPVEKICYGCHLKKPHLNVLEHQVKLQDKMLSTLKKNSQLYAVKMPLGVNNQVICITCHDPHQQGVLIKEDKAEHLRVSADLQEGVSYEPHPWTTVYAEDKKDRIELIKQQLGKKTNLQYQRIKNEVLLRLPAKNGALCITCHDFSQERTW